MSDDLLDLAITILPPAQRDLEEAAILYLSLVGENSARKTTDKIYAAIERLGHFPFSGPMIRDPELKAQGYRCAIADQFIIIYRLIDDTVFVYRVFDWRSDYPTLFSGIGSDRLI